MFTNLDKMAVGDTFTIEVMGEVLVYQVRQVQVVAPEEQEALYPQEGRDLLTLVTCTPLGVNTHRILVTGERVVPTPQEEVDKALQDSDLPRFPWWIFLSGGGVIAVAGYLWLAGRRDGRLHQATAVTAPTDGHDDDQSVAEVDNLKE
jgi:sortase family protein